MIFIAGLFVRWTGIFQLGRGTQTVEVIHISNAIRNSNLTSAAL